MSDPYRTATALALTETPPKREWYGTLKSKWILDTVTVEWERGDTDSLLIRGTTTGSSLADNEIRELIMVLQTAMTEMGE